MTRRTTALTYVAAAAFSLLVLGFLVFASVVTRRIPHSSRAADGIVVLTGSEGRIGTALHLLRSGYGERLLISGVNRKLRPDELLAHLDLPATCCVDLGYEAQDTVGNAAEASRWAARHHFKRLIVVTSNYHMPRSLNELSIAMPDVELLAHAVRPRAFADGPWWLRPGATRILASEYPKFVSSYARMAVHRMLEKYIAAASPVFQRQRVLAAGG